LFIHIIEKKKNHFVSVMRRSHSPSDRKSGQAPTLYPLWVGGKILTDGMFYSKIFLRVFLQINSKNSFSYITKNINFASATWKDLRLIATTEKKC